MRTSTRAGELGSAPGGRRRRHCHPLVATPGAVHATNGTAPSGVTLKVDLRAESLAPCRRQRPAARPIAVEDRRDGEW